MRVGGVLHLALGVRVRAVHDAARRHALDRRLAGGIDVEHPGVVRVLEGDSELLRQRRRAGEAVRLEQHEHAAAHAARRGQRGQDLGRMVPVVVHHADAVRLAAGLEPAPHAGEVREPLANVPEADLELEPHGDCRERVEHVVPPRHVQRHHAERPAARFHVEALALIANILMSRGFR